MSLIVLSAVVMVTYSFEIVFGMAGTIFMLPLLLHLFDAKTLVIYSTLPQILVATIGLARSPRTVRWPVLLGMLGFAGLGALAGFYVFLALPVAPFQILLAVTILAFGMYLVIAPGRLRLHPAVARGFDCAAGASQALFGISGPIAMTRLLATHADKTVVRNYALAFFLALNLARLAAYGVTGALSAPIREMMLVSALPLAVTLWFANHLHFRVNEKMFRRVVAWLVLLGGITMLLR